MLSPKSHDFPLDMVSTRREHATSLGHLTTILRRPSPTVVTGLVGDWRLAKALACAASEEEALGQLEETFRPLTLTYALLQGGTGVRHVGYADDLSQGWVSDEHRSSFPEFASVVRRCLHDRSAGAAYTVGFPCDLSKEAPEIALLPEFPAAGKTQLWMGSGGHTTDAHIDMHMNAICMLAGTKRVALFPPDATGLLYPGPLDRRPGGSLFSMVRMESPLPDYFPLLADAALMGSLAVIEPGDMLFIPPLWWHNVESFGLNVMINRFGYLDSLQRTFPVVRETTLAMTIGLAHANQEMRARHRAKFLAALEAPDAEEITSDSPGELSAAAAGRRLAAVVREAETSIRGSLTGHVSSTLDHFAFRHRGDPFPTLPPGEFLRMIDRLEAQLGQRPPVRA